MDISQERLKELLSYDAEAGVFTRLEVLAPRHAEKVGKPCGTTNRATGYVEIHVDGRNHYAHRLAWIYARGPIPAGARIDHRNRDPGDNRIGNLRIATQADNLRNCKARRDNSTGVKGVTFDRSRGKYAVSVGKAKLGRFDTLLDAAAARISAANAAFGEFANEQPIT